MSEFSDFLYAIKENKEVSKTLEVEFLRFILRWEVLLEHSKSQNFQDLWALFETVRHGSSQDKFYVEFGAYNGVENSNTLLLEMINDGWKGILLEPNSYVYDALKTNRSLESNKIFPYCVSDVSGTDVTFVVTDIDQQLSTDERYLNHDYNAKIRDASIKRVITASTKTLVDVLDEGQAPENIDYISVDTEGSEYDILVKFFNQNTKYNVRLWSIEHNFHPLKKEQIHNLMLSNGYISRLESISRWDSFYAKID